MQSRRCEKVHAVRTGRDGGLWLVLCLVVSIQLSRGFVDLLPLVSECDLQGAIEEGDFAQPLGEGREVEVEIIEDLAVGHEVLGGAARVAALPEILHVTRRNSPGERLTETMPVTANFDIQPFGQSVDYADAHAVKPARYLVALAAELTAGVQLGHDDFQGGLAELRHYLYGDAATVVNYPYRAIRTDGDVDSRAKTCKRLVDGVVDDLIYQVVQSPGPRGADVHSGAFADRLKTL